MVSAERINVTLTGGAPWGFRLAGGGALPLTINKIRKKSKAHVKGLQEGDAVITVNGTPVHDKSQDEALELVEGAGDSLVLEIFRGDMDELSRSKPKKPIQIGGGGEGGEGMLTLTATVDDVSESASALPVQADTSSELVLTASVDGVSSSAFGNLQGGEMQSTGGFSATFGDVSSNDFAPVQDDATASAGFTLSATVDDFSSTASNNNNNIMVDSITAEIDSSLMASTHAGSLQAASALSPSVGQSFIESHSPNRLSPHPPPARASPQAFSPVAFSPSPKNASPQQQQQQQQQQPPVKPKPASPRSPIPHHVVAPPVSPKPFSTSTSTTSATTAFDDGQTRREVTLEQQVQGRENGVQVVRKETTTTTTTTSNKKRTPFVKSQASAFNAPLQSSSLPSSSFTQKAKTTSVVKSADNKKGPAPFSCSLPPTTIIPPQQLSAPGCSYGTPRSGNPSPAPVFKPSKFVPGQGKKDIPGLYTPTSPQVEVNVHAIYRDGKENVQPPQPLFQVKNIVNEKSKTKGRETWKPNVWLPGEQPSARPQRERPASVSMDDFSPYSSFPVPIVQPGQSLVEKAKKNLRDSQRKPRHHEDEYEYYIVEESDGHKRDEKLHIFAPPVEIHNMEDSGYHDSPYSPYLPYTADGEPMYDYEDGPPSPDSTLARMRAQNQFADSAFYHTPGKSYPTIGEQMKLCKRIAQSLTSQANRRARGAKMFMKRKRKSSKWVHEGHSEWSSSAGDVANLHELDSELSPDEGGNKPLFYFKIPNLKNRISKGEKKMALTQEQFEKLRLQSAKCDHKVIPPNTCFDLVADLKASKGRGGRMFEKRKSRAEKYVVDERNARRTNPKAKLEHVLSQPVRQETTPWDAAIQHGGNVDAAFSHINEMDRNKKLNQILRYSDPPRKKQTTPMPPTMSPAQTAPMFQTSLKSDNQAFLLRGKNFNRFAKGWAGGGEYPVADKLVHIAAPTKTAGGLQQPAGDYNPKIKAWQQPGESPYVQSPNTPSQGRRQDGQWQSSTRAGGRHQQQHHPEPHYESSSNSLQRPSTQHNRPSSWQSDNYDATNYRDEYEYNYVPVDYKAFNPGEYPNVAYMQPIIPGTDL